MSIINTQRSKVNEPQVGTDDYKCGRGWTKTGNMDKQIKNNQNNEVQETREERKTFINRQEKWE